ncbi:SMC5-SMC6 complex localization factor protein 2 [Cyprinodon tularosa]|uniref:SMC5-SMC6 complex localization factor protein 2 n=1 Tax=Cyprinodon tularosa TaxID=77115 RepID=UPI0018E213DB|nr:SMC5-SMC6 complex localization factor protein 2 [Cyprinodon tularosa]XP_038148993.1 SMC5-SMC6 complex localization factor protein 2 [Cyprinodon tularosa]XP_038148994.1 SMC5-SMC6 complex localization factor protein 2 [Cyprinodon tularosa]
MDPTLQQHSLPQFKSFPQETPIKPSHVSNLIPHPQPRRILPLQTPEESCITKFGPNWSQAGITYPSALVPNSSTNTVSPVNSWRKDRLGPVSHIDPSCGNVLGSPVSSVTAVRENPSPLQNTIPSRPRCFSSSEVVPSSLTKTHTSAEESQSGRTLSNPFTALHSRNDQNSESKILSSNPESNSHVSPRQEPNTSQKLEQTHSSESITPGLDLNSTSHKRCREEEYCSESTKKPCLLGTKLVRTETNKLTPGTLQRSSLDPQTSQTSSSVFELSLKTTDTFLRADTACSTLPSTLNPSRLNSPGSKKPPAGAKQGFITTENDVVMLRLTSTPCEETPKKQNEGNPKKDKSHSAGGSRESSKPQHVAPVSTKSDFGIPVKTESKKINGSRTAEHSKASRVRRPSAVLDDVDQLFTPDSNVYVVRPPCKTPKSKMEEPTIKSPTSKSGFSPTSNCIPTVTPASCPVTQPAHGVSKLALCLPTVALERLKLEKISICSKDSIKTSPPVSTPGKQPKNENVKPQHNNSSKAKTSEGFCCPKTDTAASAQKPSPPRSKSPSLQDEECVGSKEKEEEDGFNDFDLDHSLSISYHLDLTQSSDSSEEEPMISLQEMIENTKPPDTPQKEAFSEPSTPGCQSSQSKTCLLPSTSKSGVYKNNLDQMLKEINISKKAKENEAQLLTACQENLLRLAEYEEEEDSQAEDTTEHKESLYHFSLMYTVIRDVPPGEVVFNLEKFGQIFNQETLQLRQCHVAPQGTSQKTLLWSSPAQLRLHLNIGLFEKAYRSSPCPPKVNRFLFKMMSVHNERIVSDRILQVLCDIACSAAYQIVNNDNQQFEVWVPSLADVTLVLINMGAAFVTLFPFESLQPSFTEGDLLEDVYVKSESPSKNKEEIIFPEHNCTNILKYLSYCMGLCPLAYSDDELLLLLTVVGRISLETQRLLQSNVEVSCLLYELINNIRDWSSMLPRICKALTDLTDDHHNMCLLVQLLPDSTRGQYLRRHLSLCFISKLLDGNCTYCPMEEELPLAELRQYLPKIQPSALLRSIQLKDKEEDLATQDQQAYYLCYSLLTLTNEASNLQVFRPDQKAQLLVLSSILETHIKCHIRENEKCLYRSKVKDLVARIYTKWQMLLQKSRPLNGKLYDYWQPVENFRHSEEDEDSSSAVEDEETLISEENDTTISENEEEEKEEEQMRVKEDMEVDEIPGDKEDDTKTSEAAEDEITGDLNQTAPVMQPSAMDEHIDPKECTENENQTAGMEEKSPPMPSCEPLSHDDILQFFSGC